MVETNRLRFAEKEATGIRAIDIRVPVTDNDVEKNRGRDGGKYSSEENGSSVTCGGNRFGCRLKCPKDLIS